TSTYSQIYTLSLHDALPISNKMLDTWGISKEELRKTAIQNIKEVEFQSMTSLLAEAGLPLEISEVELQQDPGLYVLTNPRRSYEIGEHTSELQSRFDLVCRL